MDTEDLSPEARIEDAGKNGRYNEVITIMGSESSNEGIQISGTFFLGVISTDARLRILLSGAGAIEVLSEALSNHMGVEELQVNAAVAVRNLALDKNVRIKIGQSSICECLLESLNTHVRTAHVLIGVLETLTILASNEPLIKRKLLRSGGASILLATLLEQQRIPEVQMAGWTCIATICTNEELAVIDFFQNSAVDGALSIMKGYTSHEGVLTATLRTVREMISSAPKVTKPLFTQSSLMETLLIILQECSKKHTVCELIYRILLGLVQDNYEAQMQAIQLKVLRATAAHLSKHKTAADLVREGVRVIAEIHGKILDDAQEAGVKLDSQIMGCLLSIQPMYLDRVDIQVECFRAFQTCYKLMSKAEQQQCRERNWEKMAQDVISRHSEVKALKHEIEVWQKTIT